jgi:hypothetical protein
MNLELVIKKRKCEDEASPRYIFVLAEANTTKKEMNWNLKFYQKNLYFA